MTPVSRNNPNMCSHPGTGKIRTGKENEKLSCVWKQVETPNNKEVDQKKKERKQEKGGSVKEVMSDRPEGLFCSTRARLLLPSSAGLLFLFLAETLARICGRTPQLVCGIKEGERCPAGQEGCTEQSHQRGDVRWA